MGNEVAAIFLVAILTVMVLVVAVSVGGEQVTIVEPSEIRGVFVKWMNVGVTWADLAAAYAPYHVNWLVGESCGTYWSRSNLESLNVTDQTYDYIGEGIAAAHAHGMKFTAMMLIGYRDATAIDPDIDAVNQDGDYIHWTCPLKGHDLVVAVATEIATKYPSLDGFMFDYIRYTTDDDNANCYCETCHTKFVADTGLTDTVWPTDVLGPAGEYYMDWLEWRVSSISNLVKDVTTAMWTVNPKLEMSIAALALWYIDGVGYGHPIREWYGQDTATMVDEGYIDMVCPMYYSSNTTDMTNVMQTCQQYFAGGDEGKVPVVPLIGGMEGGESDMTPAQLSAIVEAIRDCGTDGFLIYREIVESEDFMVSYLDDITDNPVFTLSNIQASVNDDEVTFTWATSLPATSVVEYSASDLFSVQELTYGGFKYYEVLDVAGSSTESSASEVTSHSIMIPTDGSPIYFRIQSADDYNTLSTPTLILTQSGTNPPDHYQYHDGYQTLQPSTMFATILTRLSQQDISGFFDKLKGHLETSG